VSVLFVCTGNICRSPMAAAIARAAAPGLEVASAGTFALTGSPATWEASRVAEEHGLSLAGHRAQQLTTSLVAGAELVVAMTNAHAERARQLGGRNVVLLGTGPVPDPWGCEIDVYRDTWATRTGPVPDPWGCEIDVYRDTWATLELGIPVLLRAGPQPPRGS
jgi:protein-tyrosine phosphatase